MLRSSSAVVVVVVVELRMFLALMFRFLIMTSVTLLFECFVSVCVVRGFGGCIPFFVEPENRQQELRKDFFFLVWGEIIL